MPRLAISSTRPISPMRPASTDAKVAALRYTPKTYPRCCPTHYLHGKVDQAEYERLNRLPERMAAAAAASSSQQRTSHRQSKQKKNPVAVGHYEPISILRAEAAFLAGRDKGKEGEEEG